MGSAPPAVGPPTMAPLLLLALAAVASAQDTHHCPDGWHVSEIGDEIECILLSGLEERLTKADAAIICAFHEGWLVDMDEGHGPQKNNLLKELIADAAPGEPGWPGSIFAAGHAVWRPVVDRRRGAGTTQRPQLGQLDLGPQRSRDPVVRLDEERAERLARPEVPHLPQGPGSVRFRSVALERLGLWPDRQVHL